MEHEIYQIYDRIFKRIFALSNLAIINLINALFGTNHPQDSEITYLNKEFLSSGMERRFADVLVQINSVTYHLEAQMTVDKNIVFRVFEYGFYHAMENRTEDVLQFPEPVVIYLDTVTSIPEKSTLVIDFGKQGQFRYQVSNFVYQEHEIRELNQKKMIVLIPFQLLKLRRLVAEKSDNETWQLLQKLMLDDIIGSIKANMEVGNITENDATELKELTLELYEHLYHHYEELGGHQEMRQLLEGALELPLDKYRNRIDELEEENARIEAEKTEMEAKKAEMEAKIKELEEQLASLQK